MKSIVALLCCFGLSQAGVIGLASTGTSHVSRTQDSAGAYSFAYDENHASGGTFRRESGVPGAVSGSYGLRDADGRQRTVSYVADAAGFRANIQTNEPGVEPKDPASVLINKAPAVVAAPAAPVYAAPAYAAPAYAAPAPLLAPAPAPAVLAGPPAAWTVAAPGQAISINHAVGPAPAAYVAPSAPIAVAHAPSAYSVSVAHG